MVRVQDEHGAVLEPKATLLGQDAPNLRVDPRDGRRIVQPEAARDMRLEGRVWRLPGAI